MTGFRSSDAPGIPLGDYIDDNDLSMMRTSISTGAIAFFAVGFLIIGFIQLDKDGLGVSDGELTVIPDERVPDNASELGDALRAETDIIPSPLSNDSLAPASDSVAYSTSDSRHSMETGLDNQIAATRRKSREISKKFNSIGPEQLGERLDEIMYHSEVDPSWAPTAELQVKEWISKVIGNPSYLVNSECVSQVCFVDTEMPFIEFKVALSAVNRNKIGHVGRGFLSHHIIVPVGENYFRTYFFRDTFEPSDL